MATMTSICTNCNMNVDGETKTSILSLHKFTDTEDGEIRIWDVITYVYRMGCISLDDFKIHFKNLNVQENNLIDHFMEESLGMCELCLSLLSDTYKTLKKFESLTHQATLIQQLQNVCLTKWDNITDEEQSAIHVSNCSSLSVPSKDENEDLFDEFNFEKDRSLDEAENCFTEECKYQTTDDSFENESPSVPQQNTIRSKLKSNPKKSVRKRSLRSSKQLVVKVEKISDLDLECYNEKKRTKRSSAVGVLPLEGRKLKQGKKEQPTTPKCKSKHDCKVCGKSFSDRQYLRRFHMPIHSQDMSCKLCNKVFIDIRSFQMHMKIVHKQADDEEFVKFYKTCKICGLSLRSDNFKTHMKRHGPRETLKCEKCDKEYLSKFAYEEHLQTHSDGFTPYLCRHCGSTFSDKTSLYIHEKRHTEGRKFTCEICSKKFFAKVDLQRHIMSVHSKERKFVCEECGVSYKRKCHLQKHLKIHADVAETGEYSSKCNYCEKIFKHNDSLQRHMKIHEKKYECSFCGKILSKADVLKIHEDLHRKNPDYQPRKYQTWKAGIARQPKPADAADSILSSAPST